MMFRVQKGSQKLSLCLNIPLFITSMHCDVQSELYRRFQTLFAFCGESTIRRKLPARFLNPSPRPLAVYYLLVDLHPQRYYSVIVILCCGSEQDHKPRYLRLRFLKTGPNHQQCTIFLQTWTLMDSVQSFYFFVSFLDQTVYRLKHAFIL